MKNADFREKVQKPGEADIMIGRTRKAWSHFNRVSDKRKTKVSNDRA
jgi:hypothetical protein